jgi:hypothetical protein
MFRLEGVAPEQVHAMRNGFHVRRPNAVANATEVVQLKAGRNAPNDQLVRNAMCLMGSAVPKELAVAARVFCGDP